MTESADERHVGIVKFYNPRKGYGFVTRPTGNDVFFHLTHFRTMTTPAPGNVVRFSLGHNREGATAEDLVVVPTEEVECYGGTITSLDSDGGIATTPDSFAVRFRRGDYLPHLQADALRIGDEVELNFLVQEAEGWRAKIARSPDYDPDPAANRFERRVGDEEEENRRLLGILYKTDLAEEASHAAEVLTERNMRATLSALVSRVFDRRLAREVRLELVDKIAQIYFDEECQAYLESISAQLREAVLREDDEANAAAADVLRQLLDDAAFPIRWSQYLLPFGLTLLRNLSPVPACHRLLEEPDTVELAEQWLTRVCRHVEQRRSGYGYVLTTALSTLDQVWCRKTLGQPVRRVLSRLMIAVDGEGLANQIYHLRDRISPDFLPVLLPALSQHPDLSEALRSPAQSEIFSHWIESLLRGSGEELSTEVLATVLPLIEEVRVHLVDDATIERLLRPVTESLTADEVIRMLTREDMPERAVWACLRHLDRQGELGELLAEPELRKEVTGWLRRTSSEPAHPTLPRQAEVNTALKLIDSLRGSQELTDELSDIGRSLFSGVGERLATADSKELLRLLDELDVGGLPGLTQVLGQRLLDNTLDDIARRRLLTYFGELGSPLGEAAAALAEWREQRTDALLLSRLITTIEALREADSSEARQLVDVIGVALADDEIGWHDGFVIGVEETPLGGPSARLEGFAILVPRRLFVDPSDFAPNRYVRLLHRRGMALGVASAPVSETQYLCGRLAGPLAIDERNAMVGLLLSQSGERCYFEVAQMRSGSERALQEGDLMRFTTVPAVGDQPYQKIAFNVHATFTPADLPLLLEAFGQGTDEATALAAGQQALAVAEAGSDLWRDAWSAAPAERRDALRERLSTAEQGRLAELIEPA